MVLVNEDEVLSQDSFFDFLKELVDKKIIDKIEKIIIYTKEKEYIVNFV